MKKQILLGVLLTFFIISVILYKPLLNYFINQAKNPSGFVGGVMTKIWNNTFDDMTNWGLTGIDINSNDKILDIGCGGGETIYKLAEKTPNGKIYGIDISSEAVKSSLEKNKKWVDKNQVEISVADVTSMPFNDNFFNKITAIQTHIYWDNIEKGFTEIHRTLEKDGTFILICEKDKIDYHMKKYKTNNEMNDLLVSIGFNVTDISETGNWIRFVCKK